MKKVAVVLFALCLTAVVAGSAHADRHIHAVHVDNHSHLNGVDVDFEDGSVIFTETEYGETVEITEDYELYVNDRLVELDDNQQELVKEYYDLFDQIIEEAKEIGWEGARIGVSGAHLGLKALGGLFKVVFTSYDSDDLERDMEREADKLEARAKVLERKAKVIEDMADDLEELADVMSSEIPELGKLEWF
jgi:hypothetical protein